MPIVFVHGVAVRDDDDRVLPRRFGKVPFAEVEAQLRRYVAPALSDDPGGVPITRLYWGDLGARLAWGDHFKVTRVPDAEPVAWRSLTGAALGRELERLLIAHTLDQSLWPEVIEDVWEVARHPDIGAELASREDDTAALDLLVDAVEGVRRARTHPPDETAAGPRWWETLGQQIKPTTDRAQARRRANVIGVVNRLRRPLENYVPIFMGDVITYLNHRGDAAAPGVIPQRALDTLAAAYRLKQERNEPLVVFTHSMGGQIVYDLVTHFLPRMQQYSDISIDFWAAAGCQIGLFEELKLFLASEPEHGSESGTMAPALDPAFVGHWWTSWDYGDLLSYRTEGVIDGVDETGFYFGRGLQNSHSAYLEQDDFYRTLAAKVRVHTTP